MRSMQPIQLIYCLNYSSLHHTEYKKQCRLFDSEEMRSKYIHNGTCNNLTHESVEQGHSRVIRRGRHLLLG